MGGGGIAEIRESAEKAHAWVMVTSTPTQVGLRE